MTDAVSDAIRNGPWQQTFARLEAGAIAVLSHEEGVAVLKNIGASPQKNASPLVDAGRGHGCGLPCGTANVRARPFCCGGGIGGRKSGHWLMRNTE